ncbi:MAG: hypothetical protein M1834_006185 [Cirrosporium novae-zelandiae]|nr:MAG: hypothetical protein M1834_006185 [Cirrosporium novae-zelandiae]
MFLPVLFAGCALVSSALASAPDGAFSIYAYGEGINGLKLFYADSIAYLGSASPTGASTVTDVTFTQNTSTLYATPSDTTLNWTLDSALYVRPNASYPLPMGFSAATASDTTPSDADIMGFYFYGNELLWHWKGPFWAAETDQSGLWILYFDPLDSSHDNMTTVELEYTAPTTISKERMARRWAA